MDVDSQTSQSPSLLDIALRLAKQIDLMAPGANVCIETLGGGEAVRFTTDFPLDSPAQPGRNVSIGPLPLPTIPFLLENRAKLVENLRAEVEIGGSWGVSVDREYIDGDKVKAFLSDSPKATAFTLTVMSQQGHGKLRLADVHEALVIADRELGFAPEVASSAAKARPR